MICVISLQVSLPKGNIPCFTTLLFRNKSNFFLCRFRESNIFHIHISRSKNISQSRKNFYGIRQLFFNAIPASNAKSRWVGYQICIFYVRAFDYRICFSYLRNFSFLWGGGEMTFQVFFTCSLLWKRKQSQGFFLVNVP